MLHKHGAIFERGKVICGDLNRVIFKSDLPIYLTMKMALSYFEFDKLTQIKSSYFISVFLFHAVPW